MIPEERREKIIEKLGNNSIYTIDNLTKELEVSRITIQRDIKILERKNLVEKIHGGVKLRKEGGYTFETRFKARLKTNYEKKLEISKKAIKFVEDGGTIFIDSSTTCYIFAKELLKNKFKDLNLVTNSPAIICEAITKSNDSSIRVISTGGLLRRNFNMFYGDWVNEFLKKINIDLSFISAAGVSINRWDFTSSDIQLTNILKTVIEHSKATNLLVDSSKFSKLGMLKISSLDSCKRIITDRELDDDIKKDFKKNRKNFIII